MNCIKDEESGIQQSISHRSKHRHFLIGSVTQLLQYLLSEMDFVAKIFCVNNLTINFRIKMKIIEKISQVLLNTFH